MSEVNKGSAESKALQVFRGVAALPMVPVNREEFLRNNLATYCPSIDIEEAISTTPSIAGASMDELDAMARASIRLEKNVSTSASAMSGLPGGIFGLATIPLDVAQYFGASLRIAQKLAYIYGWDSFTDEESRIDDATLNELIVLFGIMAGASSAAKAVTSISQKAAQHAAKQIQNKALTHTAIYPVVKKVLRLVGVRLTKKKFAEGVARSIPIAGAVVSGGLTYVSLHTGAKRLQKHLRELPQARGEFKFDISDTLDAENVEVSEVEVLD